MQKLPQTLSKLKLVVFFAFIRNLGFPWKAKKFNGKVRCFAPHFTALS